MIYGDLKRQDTSDIQWLIDSKLGLIKSYAAKILELQEDLIDLQDELERRNDGT